jgi:hypothetical protein
VARYYVTPFSALNEFYHREGILMSEIATTKFLISLDQYDTLVLDSRPVS